MAHRKNLNICYCLVILLLSCLSISSNASTVLFEGYSEVTSMKFPVGYVIYRYQVDDVKKKYLATYFLKVGKPFDISESLHAESDYEMNPIEYSYTAMSPKEKKTVDAKFKNGVMTANVKTNGVNQKVEKKIPKGVFLSTFLFYLILKSKDGLKANTNFNFQAIAEEDANIYSGQALIGKEELWKGFQVYSVTQKFKDLDYSSVINDRGEVLSTSSPSQGMGTELVLDSEPLIKKYGGESNLKTVFGGIPKGIENVLAKQKLPIGSGALLQTTKDNGSKENPTTEPSVPEKSKTPTNSTDSKSKTSAPVQQDSVSTPEGGKKETK